MISVSVLGSPAWLVPYGPNTDDPVSVKASIDVESMRRQTGRTHRRAQACALRITQGWITQMTAADFYAARAASLAAQNEPIVVPFWPAARKTTQAAAMTSGLTIAWKADWSSYAINPGSLATYDYFAPLLMGVFKQPPRLTSQSSDTVRAEIVLIEQSPLSCALVPPVAADITLATPDGYAAAVFPFMHEPGTDPKLTFGQVEIERQPIGPGRQPAEIFYPQARETVVQPSYKLKSSTEGIALLGWWVRRSGGADPCWIATTQKIGDLTGDLAIGATSIPTVQPISVNAGDTIALITTGSGAEFVRVQSIVGGVPQLAGPTAVAHPKRWTIVAPALLAQHTDQELTLDFHRAANDWLVTTTLAFREVVPEYAATDGEVRGTTLGRLSAEAWLFRIDLDYVGAVQSWFVTNWESGGTTPDAQVWDYHPCDIDRLTQSIDLEDDSCTFKIRWWDGCPWENWRPGKLSATGKLTVYRSAVSTAGVLGVPVQVWKGELSTPKREGPMLTVKVLGANALFSQKAPRQLMRTTCYKRLYGGRCGLNVEEWKHNATVVSIAGQAITIGTIARTDGNPLHDGFGFANWFALGWAQWTNGAGQPIRAEIIASTALAGGQITLTLGRPLGCSVGNAVVVVPGCDKQKATCWIYDAVNNPTGKFNNFNSFGGFFDMPAVSPNLKVPNSTSNPAKK